MTKDLKKVKAIKEPVEEIELIIKDVKKSFKHLKDKLDPSKKIYS